MSQAGQQGSAGGPAGSRARWRFYTVPAPGEAGHETWRGDDWQHGGGSVWVTGSFDPDLNLTYWGVGNPGPDWNPDQRPGDNLYTDSVVALDPDSGRLKWYFQFTPHDAYDYDSVQIPVLVDADWQGRPRKLMLWGKVNWASGLDESGRPVETPQPEGSPTYPGVQGATNWYSPSYSPRTRLFYLSAWEGYGHVFTREPVEYEAGRRFGGGRYISALPGDVNVPNIRRGPINTWTEAAGHGAVLAIEPLTGKTAWRFEMTDVTDSGILTTASNLLFTGGREGYFHALDARTGALIWKTNLGGQIASGPMTYEAAGKQYVAIAAGHSLFAFALRE